MLPNGINHKVDKYIIDKFIQYADAIIAISDNEIKHFDLSNKIHIIPNPHDFTATNSFRTTKKDNNRKIVIGMCAAFLEIKGHLDFLNAAKIVNNELEKSEFEIEFRIIGYPQGHFSFKEIAKKILRYGYKSHFDRKIKQLKLTNLIIIPYAFDIYKELEVFDIYVRPDVTGNPWGRDVIEAMAMKKPVIATGTSEFYVKNNETGYLVPINQPNKMADKILSLIRNPALREIMGNRGYESIKNKCDLDIYGNEIMNIYNQLLECKGK
jgi:glycosyltransferase involved in cell wall biosynthesis